MQRQRHQLIFYVIFSVVFYVIFREDIPSKPLAKHVLPSDIEGIFLELNFGNVNGFK